MKAQALILEGDALKILSLLPTGSISAVITDLPYGITNNSWDSLLPLEPLWEELWRVLKPNGVAVLHSSSIFTAIIMMSCKKWFKYKMCWIKSCATNFLNAKKQPLRKHEDICVFYKKQPTYNAQKSKGTPYSKNHKTQIAHAGTYNPYIRRTTVSLDGSRYPTDVLEFSGAGTEGGTYHTTQKPLSLLSYLVKTYTNEGDIVLDATSGSGTTLLASASNNRHSIGIELNDNVVKANNIKVDLIDVTNDRLLTAINTESIRVVRKNEDAISGIKDFYEKIANSAIN